MSDTLAARYASKTMIDIWSDDHRYKLWRHIWYVLAETQHKMKIMDDKGNPRITEAKLNALGHAKNEPIDYAKVAEYEKKFRHDIMAHIHAFGDLAPEARDIIHLGATSCDVTDNADLLLIRAGLGVLEIKVQQILNAYVDLIKKWHEQPCLGFTHFQPAQLTTVGKRFALWAQDLAEDFYSVHEIRNTMRLRGLKGATGTQASFVELTGHPLKANVLDEQFCDAFHMGTYRIVGQTYPRKFDFQVMSALAGIAQSAHKFATDLRLLQHDKEIEEPFEEEQVGSSAMAYKRNPMRSERICGLARFVMNLLPNTLDTAANQWLERTLDDSSNRRLVIPQAFMAVDGILRIYLNILKGLNVNVHVINRRVDNEYPFMVTEKIMMQAVQRGLDRQEVHEIIRQKSQSAAMAVKNGKPNNLFELLSEAFNTNDDLIDFWEFQPKNLTGRASEQALQMASFLPCDKEMKEIQEEPLVV